MALPGSTLPPKEAFQRLIEGLQAFIRENLALFKAEASDELRALSRDLLVAAIGLPFLLVGYLLLMVAAAFALALVLPVWAAFGIVAVINLAAGAALTFVLAGRIARQRRPLPETGAELARNKQWVAQLKSATELRPQPAPPGAHSATTEVKHG